MTQNLYSQFVMKAPSRNSVAQRLLGSPGTGIAPPVPKSTAVKSFFAKANKSHGTLAQNSYNLGTNGGLNGFGFFGALSGDMLVQGVEFSHVWSMEDLTASTQRAKNWLSEVSGGPRGMEFKPQDFGFKPIQPSLISAAQKGWNALNEAAGRNNPIAVRAVTDLQAQLVAAAAEVDATWDGVRAFIASRSPELESRRTGALNRVKDTLQAIADQGQAVQTAAAAVKAEETKQFIQQYQQTGGGSSQQQGPQKPASSGFKLSPVMMLGGVAVLGAVLVVVKKMKKR